MKQSISACSNTAGVVDLGPKLCRFEGNPVETLRNAAARFWLGARRHPRLAAGACAVVLGMPLAVIAMTTTPAQAHPGGTARAVGAGPGLAPTVNWALSGTASATSAESGEPASNAIDGDAGTDWCTSGWTGTLEVDLERPGQVAD